MAAKEKNLEGIKGWLLVFFLYFTFIAINSIISIVMVSFSSNKYLKIPDSASPNILVWLYLINFILVFSLSLLTLIMILKKKKIAVKFAIATSWILIISNLIVNIARYFILGIDYYGMVDPRLETILKSKSIVIGAFIFQAIKGIGLALAVTFYFYLSNRVKKTLKN